METPPPYLRLDRRSTLAVDARTVTRLIPYATLQRKHHGHDARSRSSPVRHYGRVAFIVDLILAFSVQACTVLPVCLVRTDTRGNCSALCRGRSLCGPSSSVTHTTTGQPHIRVASPGRNPASVQGKASTDADASAAAGELGGSDSSCGSDTDGWIGDRSAFLTFAPVILMLYRAGVLHDIIIVCKLQNSVCK